MTSELILPDSMLPKAKNAGAEIVLKALPQLRSFLPQHVDAGQFAAGLIAECNRLHGVQTDSLQIAAMNLCVIGLMPGPALGHAHIVPFKEKGTPKAQVIIGYKGFLELAFANRFLSDCSPELVLQGEIVERWHDEDGAHFRHDLPQDRPHPNRENIVGAYCSWRTSAGGKGVTFVDRGDIQRADRGASSKTPWATDYAAMVLKCPIRKAAKLWRMGQRMAEAVLIDEQGDRGVDQSALRTFPGEYREPEAEPILPQLRAILRDKVGTGTASEEIMVIEWATDSDLSAVEIIEDLRGEEFDDVLQRALDQLMNWPRISGGNHWDQILPHARRRREARNG